jgi:hypothetical protein
MRVWRQAKVSAPSLALDRVCALTARARALALARSLPLLLPRAFARPRAAFAPRREHRVEFALPAAPKKAASTVRCRARSRDASGDSLRRAARPLAKLPAAHLSRRRAQ